MIVSKDFILQRKTKRFSRRWVFQTQNDASLVGRKEKQIRIRMALTGKNMIRQQPRLCLLNDSQQSLGGGWSFQRNLKEALRQKIQVVDRLEEANVCLVSGPTMVTRETINKVKEMGKKLIVRLDNVPRNSRNRNTGTSRMTDFANAADGVVWQCEWAHHYLKDVIKPKFERIIYNGVDTNIFKKDGDRYDFNGDPVYFYSRYNRDETKNWEVAWYEYQLIHRENPKAVLVLVGQFSPEQIEYNFDFFRGERYVFQGVVDNPNEMAKIMRSCNYFLATYFNDCYSNTYQEAMACGMELIKPNMSGGTPELLYNGVRDLEAMGNDYLKFIEEVLEK